MSKLQVRQLPERGGYSIPFAEIRQNAHVFFRELIRAETKYPSRDPAGEASDEIISQEIAVTLEVQCRSRAVQVFTAMAVEAAINAYGLIRYGEEEFERYERSKRPGPVQKLKDLLDHPMAGRPKDDDELIERINRLCRKRNTLVHQRSDESAVDDDGAFRFIADVQRPRLDRGAAEESLEDMERFFQLFRVRDRETTIFFLL